MMSWRNTSRRGSRGFADSQVRRTLSRSLARHDRIRVLLLGVAAFLGGLLEAVVLVLIVNIATQPVTDSSDIAVDLPALGTVSASTGVVLSTAVAVCLALIAMHVITARLTASLTAGVLSDARLRLMRAYKGATWPAQSMSREGALQEAASNLSLQTASLFLSLSTLLTAVLGLTGILFAAILVDPLLTAGVVVSGGALFALLRPLSSWTRRNARRFVSANASYSEAISEWAAMSLEMRVFGVENQELERLAGRVSDVSMKMRRTRLLSRLGSSLFKDLALLFVIAALAVLLLAFPDVELAAIGAVVLLVIRCLSYAQQAQGAMQQLAEQAPFADALDERSTLLEHSQEVRGSTALGTLSSARFVNVSFSYPDGRIGLQDVSTSIDFGETIGIIGPSGSGKSTFANLLLRLLEPTEGAVEVNGADYRTFGHSSWSRAVAVVPQEARLFVGSVADNIRYFRAHVDDTAVETAARMARVYEDICNLPDGFATVLGPRGAGLSGGQRQRVAIARALAGRPQLIVLDEPTSALDTASELAFRRTLHQLKGLTTVVIIAHRLDTLEVCDRVLALRSGRIVGEGSLETALASVGFEMS